MGIKSYHFPISILNTGKQTKQVKDLGVKTERKIGGDLFRQRIRED